MRDDARRVDCRYLAAALLAQDDAGPEEHWEPLTVCDHPLVPFTRTHGLTEDDCRGCEHNTWCEAEK